MGFKSWTMYCNFQFNCELRAIEVDEGFEGFFGWCLSDDHSEEKAPFTSLADCSSCSSPEDMFHASLVFAKNCYEDKNISLCWCWLGENNSVMCPIEELDLNSWGDCDQWLLKLKASIQAKKIQSVTCLAFKKGKLAARL